MAIPCNPHDFERFTKLAMALSQQNPPVEMSIYASSDKNEQRRYVSLEIKGHLSEETILKVFGIPASDNEN